MSPVDPSVAGAEAAPGLFANFRVAIQRVDGVRFRSFLVFLLALALVFFRPLVDLGRLAGSSDLYSHLFLIPFISLYLTGLRGRTLPSNLSTAWGPALLFAGLGVIVLLGHRQLAAHGWKPEPVDLLARSMAAFLAFATAGAFLFLGTSLMRAVAFPWTFLVFLVPLPKALENGLEIFFQYTSAEAANLLMSVTGLSVFREGLVFKLPGITVEVAQECSGIRSSLVLFITSLVAGQMFLRSPWKRALLTFVVIPLAILRNGFRIFTISWLCVNVGPEMIDSPIHHRGGPIFFILSLVPFFALLFLLRRKETQGASAATNLPGPIR